MNYLYCPECGEYLGSLGANQCYSCGWHQEPQEETKEIKMYSNYFETRKDMQHGLEILKQVLYDFQNKENVSIYTCDCIEWNGTVVDQDAAFSLKMWIKDQICGKFSYGTWIAHYHPEILVKEKLHDSREVDESEKIAKSRMLWIKHMISELEKYLEENNDSNDSNS